MKKVLMLFLLLFFSASAFAQDTIWFNGTWEEAKMKAQDEDKFILIFYWEDG